MGPREILIQLKAQCMKLNALEQSYRQTPENAAGEAADFVACEKEALQAIEESLALWESCAPGERREFTDEAAEIRGMIQSALELHNQNQSAMEAWGDQVKRSLEETRKALQMVSLLPQSQGARCVDMLG